MSIHYLFPRSFHILCRRTIGFFAITLGLALFAASSAQAQAVNERICTMNGYLAFTGPLTNQYQNHQVSGAAVITTCVDQTGSGTGVNGTMTIEGSGIGNCALQSFTLTQLIDWNYGGSSVVTMQPPTSLPAALGAYTGTGTAGDFNGAPVVATLSSIDPLQTLNCVLGITPIGVYTFTGVQTFTHIDTDG